MSTFVCSHSGIRISTHLVSELLPSQNVYVQMRHGLTAVFALVRNKSEALAKSEFIDVLGQLFETAAEKRRLLVVHLGDIAKVLFGDEEQVYLCLRIQIFDDDHILIFIKLC